MDVLAALLKPPPFKPKNRDDPEQLLQDWVEYIKLFNHFIGVAGLDADHTDNHVNCGVCKRHKSMLRLIGGRK